MYLGCPLGVRPATRSLRLHQRHQPINRLTERRVLRLAEVVEHDFDLFFRLTDMPLH